MTVATLIQGLRTRGVVLRPDGAFLEYEAPAGALSRADLETLRQRKEMVLAYLRWEARALGPPAPGIEVPPEAAAPEGAPAPAVEVAPALRCYVCRGRRFWRSIYGPVVCARCHPPAAAALVAAWVGPAADAGGVRPS